MNEEIKIGGNWRIANKNYNGEILINEENGFIGLVIYYEDTEHPLTAELFRK